MKIENLAGNAGLLVRVGQLLPLALACVLGACGDEAEVQQVEMEQQESQPEGERPPAREGPDGCYIGAQMRCDCAIVEADCTEAVGLWTNGCASCAAAP